MTTTLTSLTVDYTSENFWVGTIVTTLSSTSIPASATGGIITDTSSPPLRRTTMTAASTTASSAAASSTPTSSSSSSGPSTGQLIGIIVGSVAGGCLLICIIFWFCWRRKRKLAARRRTKARIDSPRRITRQSFQVPASNNQPEREIANQQVAWPRPVNPNSIGLAVTPSERLTNPRPGTRSFQPTSAPILEDRESGPSNFRERFFAPPQSASHSEQVPTKHSSDATTIRTSCTLPTPDRPSIAVLRPWSTATSANTTFEEDMEFQPVDVPPLPTFTAVEVPLKAMNPVRKQGKPARLDLEAGIKRSFNKAISHVPMTPRYDNGYRESQRKPSVPTIPTSKLRSARSIDRSRPTTSSANAASNSQSMATPTRKYSATPVRATPTSRFLEIPNRESSFRHFMDDGDEEWLLRPSNKTTPQSTATTATRPPLSVNRNRDTSAQSPIRNLSYPKIPISASESRLAGRKSILKPSSAKRTAYGSATSSADDVERYSTRPLPQISTTNHDDPFVGPSNTTRLFHTPLRLHVPSPSSQDSPDQNSRPSATSPRATFTPNRTNTGDLVLTVDM